MRQIRRALISVFNKQGLEDFVKGLNRFGVEVIASGGTARAIAAAGVPVTDVAQVTGAAEMLDGRVKTLHPALHGGILARADDPEHEAELARHGLSRIDMVVVNFYPFEDAVASGDTDGAIIEMIDIGGPAMTRAAAKNHNACAVITDPEDYPRILEAMEQSEGHLSLNLRRDLAARAFQRTAAYEVAIANWITGGALERPLWLRQQALRYGENPHQSAALYATPETNKAGEEVRPPSLISARQIQGKELSYNNVLDADMALAQAMEFADPAAIIVKHGNPCGVAQDPVLQTAFRRAFATDPKSAFGGIICLTREVDGPTAEAILENFCEVVLAPSVSLEAQELLARKANIRVLELGQMPEQRPVSRVRSVLGGVLVQTANVGLSDPEGWRHVSGPAPDADLAADLCFAEAVVKHVSSNAIVLAGELATWGLGAGQMSRVDAVWMAGHKMREAFGDQRPARLVMASDAFFPFPDSVEQAAALGVTALLQPGGSIRDDAVIDAAEKAGMTMVFTGRRHFRH